MLLKIVFWVVVVVVALFVLLWLNALRASFARDRKLRKRIDPVLKQVKAGDATAQQSIVTLAADPETRWFLLSELAEIGKREWFPREYDTPELLAESNLVYWLMHGNELGVAPAKIELLKSTKVEKDGRQGTYFLFRFRAPEDHWAASDGWMAGLAGPFWDGETDPSELRHTFSELESCAERTDDEHVEYLLKSARRWGLVVPS